MGFFCTFASGSSGNCALYVDGRARILIDAGTSLKHITSCLRAVNMTPEALSHILITHSHSDHTAALSMLLKHTRAAVVCTEETAAALPAAPERVIVLHAGESAMLESCRVRSFATPHDAPGSCGYVLGSGEGQVAVCTDLGVMTPEIAATVLGSPTVLLESNHDVGMLRDGPYPYYLKQRILSDHGHLSNESCARAARYFVRNGTRRVLLAHLSAENNTPERALDSTRTLLDADGYGDVRVEVAPRRGVGEAVLF